MIGLLLVSPLFLGWLGWFFMGEVALHQSSSQLVRTQEGLVSVTFTEAFPRIQSGGDAQLRLVGVDGDVDRVLVGYVHRFVPHADGSTEAHIVLRSDDLASIEQLVGEASVEIDEISPAAFLWDLVDGE